MKTVFTKADDVIHLFAQRTQSNARSSNVFFESTNKLYSYGYHYLLAEFIDNETILINDTGYSSTTSKHISIVSYATRQYKQFFKTKTNIDLVYGSIKSLCSKLANARKPEIYINSILSLWESLNEFLVYKKLTKIVKKNDKFKEIAKIVKAITLDSEGYKERLLDIKRKDAISKAKKDAKNLKDKLVKFESFEINSFRVGDEDYLRISKDNKFIETSQNVSVDINQARSLYQMILNNKDIVGYKIGNYTVNSINGTLKIGCHRINIKSMHKIGKIILA